MTPGGGARGRRARAGCPEASGDLKHQSVFPARLCVLGGCCGTDGRHIRAIAQRLAAGKSRSR
ncbi:MAG: homocysteine S-methyltransferase family protein [Candidatus Eisenbacteria sp.]|nr:homocysteine S-methyltransferase family protein [Candidatus Eisenbacteria bacterium]